MGHHPAFREQGRTVLLTTHYMDEAERLCDRVAVVDHGKVIALGSPRELIASLGGEHVIEFTLNNDEPGTRTRRSTCPDPPRDAGRDGGSTGGRSLRLSVTEPHVALPAILERLPPDSQLELASLTTRHASLEDVFVTLTGRHLRRRGRVVTPLGQLVLARLRAFYREPEAVFWVYGFPLLMVVALGIAFRNKPVEQVDVDVQAGPQAEKVRDALLRQSTARGLTFDVQIDDEETSRRRLRTGRTDLVVVVSPRTAAISTVLDPAAPRAASRGRPWTTRCSAPRAGPIRCRRWQTRK